MLFKLESLPTLVILALKNSIGELHFIKLVLKLIIYMSSNVGLKITSLGKMPRTILEWTMQLTLVVSLQIQKINSQSV